jgi:hypothetical protein
MGNKKKSQKADKYGQITFGEETKLLVGIIGQPAILDLVPEKNREAYERKLQRMYNGEMSKNGFTSLQRYCKKFCKNMIKYKVSPRVIRDIKLNLHHFLFDFSLYTESNIILGKFKNEIALFLLYEQALHHIDSPENDPFELIDFKVSEKDVLVFLTDSYKKVFDEIMQVFKNKETFYKEINNYCDNNRKKYPKLSEKKVTNYRQNIINWQNENVDDPNYVYNPFWRTLVPVLDYLCEREHFPFVHRLIGLYLRKNAQKALLDILGVSEDKLKKIGIKIANMIRRKKRPEKIPYDLYFDDIWLRNQRFNIAKCLQFQNNYENSIDVEKSNIIIEYLKCNYLRSSEEKFLFFWLQTRAKIFEKHSNLRGHKEVQKKNLGCFRCCLDGYKKAFDELLKDITNSAFETQFLMEIMLINYIFYPRRVATRDYYEHGCTTLKIFNANIMSWEKMLNKLKEFPKDIRKALVNIHSKHCPIK